MADETAVVTESTPATSAPTETTTETTATSAPVDGGGQAAPEPEFQSDALIDDSLEPIEAVSTEAAVPSGLDEFLSLSPYIKDADGLKGAISDSNMLWEITSGQRPAGDMLAALKQNNPEVWTNVVNGLAEYIQKESGYAFVPKDQVTQQQVSPEMQEIQRLKSQLESENKQKAEAAYTQRINAAQKQIFDQVTANLKGSWLEGEESYVLSLLGQKLGGKTEAIVTAAEKGDFSQINAALKEVRKEERERYNNRIKAVTKRRQALANSRPKTDGGTATDVKDTGEFDLKTREGRMKFAQSQLQN